MILRRLSAVAALSGLFVVDLVQASLAVARAALARDPELRPAIVEVPVSLRTPTGVAVFASFLSLTPGSVALHVAHDRRSIFVHLLDTRDADASVARFKRLFERWIARAER